MGHLAKQSLHTDRGLVRFEHQHAEAAELGPDPKLHRDSRSGYLLWLASAWSSELADGSLNSKTANALLARLRSVKSFSSQCGDHQMHHSFARCDDVEHQISRICPWRSGADSRNWRSARTKDRRHGAPLPRHAGWSLVVKSPTPTEPRMVFQGPTSHHLTTSPQPHSTTTIVKPTTAQHRMLHQ